jgi:hypothetical protein
MFFFLAVFGHHVAFVDSWPRISLPQKGVLYDIPNALI